MKCVKLKNIWNKIVRRKSCYMKPVFSVGIVGAPKASLTPGMIYYYYYENLVHSRALERGFY